MLAAIDIGNTHIVVGVYDGDELRCRLRFRTERKATVDEIGHWLSVLISNHGLLKKDIHAFAIGSVVPELEQTFSKACNLYFGHSPLWVSKELKPAMPLLIDNPAELGDDRLVNSYAAYKRFGGPIIILDSGTATTFDVVSAKGEYLGGAIAPGLDVSKEALFQAASKLRHVELENPKRVIGKNTKEHVQIGLVRGYGALIDGLVKSMEEEMGVSSQVVATGGLAPFIRQASKTIERVEPDLTLSGLRLLYQEYFSGTLDSFREDRFKRPLGSETAASQEV